MVGSGQKDWPAVRAALPQVGISALAGFKRVYDDSTELYSEVQTKNTDNADDQMSVTVGSKSGGQKWLATAQYNSMLEKAKSKGYKPVPRLEPSMKTVVAVHQWVSKDLFPRVKWSEVMSKEDQEIKDLEVSQRARFEVAGLVQEPLVQEAKFMKSAKLLEKITILENAMVLCGFCTKDALSAHYEQVADVAARFPSRNGELLVAEALVRSAVADAYSETRSVVSAMEKTYQGQLAIGPRTFFRKVESVQPVVQVQQQQPPIPNIPRRGRQIPAPAFPTAPEQPPAPRITNFDGKCRAFNCGECERGGECWFQHTCALVGCTTPSCSGLKKGHPQAYTVAEQSGELVFGKGRGKGSWDLAASARNIRNGRLLLLDLDNRLDALHLSEKSTWADCQLALVGFLHRRDNAARLAVGICHRAPDQRLRHQQLAVSRGEARRNIRYLLVMSRECVLSTKSAEYHGVFENCDFF